MLTFPLFRFTAGKICFTSSYFTQLAVGAFYYGRLSWERITPFFAYPADIRKVIYTTNVIESVNMSLRKISKNRGSFPTDETAVRLLYPALQNIARKWTMPIKEWKAALNRFATICEDRMPAL